MKRILILFIIFSSLFLSAEEYNCFSIAAGSKATADGYVLLAHNEDDGGKNFLDVHKIPAQTHTADKTVKLKNGGLVPEVEQTFAALWFQLPGQEFGDSYMNEHGVVIATDQCSSREDKGDITNGGIGFMLRRLMALRAKSARQAVQVAGALLEQFGYYDSGRTYCIADPKETWVLSVVRGKHWIAQRVPDNQVAVIANCFTIGQVNLSDKQNFIASPDLIDYAIKRSWYIPKRDGDFDFARAYSDPEALKTRANTLRMWRAISLLAKDPYKLDDRFPFSFTPKRKVKIVDLFRVLRDHYEDTEYDLTQGFKTGSPHTPANNRTICCETTRYAFVAQPRGDLPIEIGPVAWISFGRPDANPFSPWHISLLSPPAGYTQDSTEAALKTHFKKPAGFFTPGPDFAYGCYARLADLVDRQYKTRIKVVQKEWKNFENDLFKNQRKNDKNFLYLLQKNKGIALKMITNSIHEIEYRKWFLTCDLLSRLQSPE